MTLRSCLYAGTVVHKRLAPRQHGFSYRVFALCLDVDEIPLLDEKLRLFSANRRNLLSFFDSDLGPPGTEPVAAKVRRILDRHSLSRFGHDIRLICYPRVLGYVFNPLSVYFCKDAKGDLGVIVYEVSNTFGERKSYVIETGGEPRDCLAQKCAKELYVSPYTGAEGSYGFRIVPPSEQIVVGVTFREQGRATLKTHFRGAQVPLTDANIAAMLIRHPLMTVKVITAIHVEAARLWLKGVPLVERHASPAFSTTLVKSARQEVRHA